MELKIGDDAWYYEGKWWCIFCNTKNLKLLDDLGIKHQYHSPKTRIINELTFDSPEDEHMAIMHFRKD